MAVVAVGYPAARKRNSTRRKLTDIYYPEKYGEALKVEDIDTKRN